VKYSPCRADFVGTSRDPADAELPGRKAGGYLLKGLFIGVKYPG
jgi:hypothetical protein